MADNPRIHPVRDVEAPQTPAAPLMPRNASKSEKPEPTAAAKHLPPPPRTLPAKPPKKRSCCCKCVCWVVSLLLILIVAIGIAIGILFLVFRPKLPKYSVDHLRISHLNLSTNNELSATFNLTITARNPNKEIGIYYEGGSRIRAYYEKTKLCEGSLPKFYQGYRNTTTLNLLLSGQTQDATGLAGRLQQQQQQTGNIPLDLRVKQPVRIKLGELKLFKVKYRVNCRLMVDSLSENKEIRIESSSCKFRLRL